MTDDVELLRRYADQRDEAAFGELVRRHLGLVSHAALRECGGDSHLARRAFGSAGEPPKTVTGFRLMVRRLALALMLLTRLAGQPAKPPPGMAPDPPASATKPEEPRFEFSLLPKSLQKNPRLDATVIGEVTDEGKNRPPVSVANPVFYTLISAGYQERGDATGEKTLNAETIEKILTRALAANGYFAAKLPEKSSLLIIYTWGAHRLLASSDWTELGNARRAFEVSGAESAVAITRNLLERVELVGGEKFARVFAQKLREASDLIESQDPRLGAQPVLGPERLAFANAMNLFKLGNPKTALLVDHATEEMYFVVASAYDYSAAAKHERKLLWRTRMTVSSAGVSQDQNLPALIASAAPFFGKDMAEPEVLTPRVKEGRVEIGPATVVEGDVALPSDSPPANAKSPP